jgi:hypothetical protein
MNYSNSHTDPAPVPYYRTETTYRKSSDHWYNSNLVYIKFGNVFSFIIKNLELVITFLNPVSCTLIPVAL